MHTWDSQVDKWEAGKKSSFTLHIVYVMHSVSYKIFQEETKIMISHNKEESLSFLQKWYIKNYRLVMSKLTEHYIRTFSSSLSSTLHLGQVQFGRQNYYQEKKNIMKNG